MTDHRPAGLLLFAHGARDPNWALPFEAVARHCRAARGEPDQTDQADRADQAQSSVALAFLEFMVPDLLQAGAQLVAQGCTRVVVVPLFLGAGGHVRKDLPKLMTQLREAHPQTQFSLQPAAGESAAVVAAMAEVALAATGEAVASTAAPTSMPRTAPTTPPNDAA